jgi:hypothetical protein
MSNPSRLQVDPIGHVQAAVLAQVLHQADDLAGQPAVTQRVVEREVERDHLAPFARHGEALLAAHPELHVVGTELDRSPRGGRA